MRGHPLFDPREQQGSGRYDNPDRYGAIYLARDQISAIAEWLAPFRGQILDNGDLERRDRRVLAVVALDSPALAEVVDLDEPRELVVRRLRPSGVATHHRPDTQHVAADIYEEGVVGFAWWSTLEAAWQNVTLFAERALPRLMVIEPPHPLAFGDPLVHEAAAGVGVRLR